MILAAYLQPGLVSVEPALTGLGRAQISPPGLLNLTFVT